MDRLPSEQPDHTDSPSKIQEMLRTIFYLSRLGAIAMGIGYLFTLLHIPVSWLLGPMIFGISYALFRGEAQTLPSIFSIIGQAIIALATATRFSLDTFVLAKTYAFPLLGCIAVTGSFSILNGYLLSRWTGLDRATSFLGCIPGAGPSLVALSEDLGGDAIAVAFLQYLRIILVSLIVPSLVTFWSLGEQPSNVAAIVSSPSPPLPLSINLAILTICGMLGVVLGRKIKLPAAIFLGPLFTGLIIVWTLPYSFHVPFPIFATGLLLFGLSIGLKFDLETSHKLFKAVFIQLGLVLLLILICLAVGYEFHQITHINILTAILGTTPGGLTAMTATVIEIGGDAGLVVAMQMTRMLLILLFTPWLASSLLQNKITS